MKFIYIFAFAHLRIGFKTLRYLPCIKHVGISHVFIQRNFILSDSTWIQINILKGAHQERDELLCLLFWLLKILFFYLLPRICSLCLRFQADLNFLIFLPYAGGAILSYWDLYLYSISIFVFLWLSMLLCICNSWIDLMRNWDVSTSFLTILSIRTNLLGYRNWFLLICHTNIIPPSWLCRCSCWRHSMHGLGDNILWKYSGQIEGFRIHYSWCDRHWHIHRCSY